MGTDAERGALHSKTPENNRRLSLGFGKRRITHSFVEESNGVRGLGTKRVTTCSAEVQWLGGAEEL